MISLWRRLWRIKIHWDLVFGWERLAMLLYFSFCLLPTLERTPHWPFRGLFLPALAFTFVIGVRLCRDLHAFPNDWLALRYLVAVLFGIGVPRVTVTDGRLDLEGDPWVRRCGGPAVLKVQAGHAVLVERLQAEPLVYQEGAHFLKPYQFVRTILPTRNLKGRISTMKAATRDGIWMEVRGIQYGYAAANDQDLETGARVKSSYFAALNRFAYGRAVGKPDKDQKEPLDEFIGAVEGVIKSVIGDYIGENRLDEITLPRYNRLEPRQEIADQLMSGKARERFAGMGAKLLWVDVGVFDFLDEGVKNQRLNSWKIGWMGRAKVMEAHGEAYKLSNRELGRAEAQAEMLTGILHALEDVSPSGNEDEDETQDKNRTLENVILVRTAQMLESLTSLYEEERYS